MTLSAATQQALSDKVRQLEIARFMQFVEKGTAHDACWRWTGYIQTGSAGRGGGYGRVRFNDRKDWAHRVAYILFVGPLAKGECALHDCETRPDTAGRQCVRPTHLFKGTRTDNAADRDAKGRTSRGEKHAAAMRAAWARRKAQLDYAPPRGWTGRRKVKGQEVLL